MRGQKIEDICFFEAAGNIHHLKMDVTERKSCNKAICKVGEQGLDFVVNNAGISERSWSTEVTLEMSQKIQSVNVEAVYTLCQMAYPYLKRAPAGGRIVNIGSMAADLGFSEVVPYCASKSSVLGIMRGLSVEWAKDNILVNSVSPGWFPSELHRRLLDPEREKSILNRMPLQTKQPCGLW